MQVNTFMRYINSVSAMSTISLEGTLTPQLYKCLNCILY